MNHSYREEMKLERHRHRAEMVMYHRNWLPDSFICWYLNGFSDHGERYLAGQPQPPWFVRTYWILKHWHVRWKQRPPTDIADVYRMSRSNITGELAKPSAIIPLAPGQKVLFIPVVKGDMVECLDMKTGERRSVLITPEMREDFRHAMWSKAFPDLSYEERKILWHSEEGDFQIDRSEIIPLLARPKFDLPSGIGDYPRPHCPKCGSSGPELGTPLDKRTPNGWGDSFFTCRDCKHHWTWKSAFPMLVEDQTGKTGATLRMTNLAINLKALGMTGLTVDELNKGLKRLAQVPCIAAMTPEQRLEIVEQQKIMALHEKANRLSKPTSSREKHSAGLW